MNPEAAIKLIARFSVASVKATHAMGNNKTANREEERAARAIFTAIIGRKPNAEEETAISNVLD